jgi:hypothetical protein
MKEAVFRYDPMTLKSIPQRTPGERVVVADREYFVRSDGALQRVDGKRQRKGKTWRNNRNG